MGKEPHTRQIFKVGIKARSLVFKVPRSRQRCEVSWGCSAVAPSAKSLYRAAFQSCQWCLQQVADICCERFLVGPCDGNHSV